MLALLDTESDPAALAAVPRWFEEWEQVLSRFRSDSELSRLNCAASGPQVVSEVLWDVFAAAIEAADATDGLVNPLVLDALLAAGYDQDFDLLDRQGDGLTLGLGSIGTLRRIGSAPSRQLSDVTLDPYARSICLPQGALLDFGGVAKGWAAEQAARRLGETGPALVSAGGDIAVTGPRADGGPWEIGVEDPFNSGLFVDHIFLTSGGVATSGKDRRHWIRNGMAQHHIIDPRTGLPAETDVLTATVVADSAARAEAFAKAVLISGSGAGLDWLDHDDSIAGLLILDNGERLYSRQMERFL